MLVLGIDPGTAVTGYGLVRDERTNGRGPAGIGMRLVECGVIRTRPRDPLATRLREIHQGISELIARHKPDHLAVEDVFYARNVRTTLALGHARGVVLLAGETAGIAIHEFPPAEVKKAIVGTGSATKEQVQFMIAQLLRLRAAPEPADASDGVAAAVTYLLTAHLDRLTTGRHRANGSRPAMDPVPRARRSDVTAENAEANEAHRHSVTAENAKANEAHRHSITAAANAEANETHRHSVTAENAKANEAHRHSGAPSARRIK